VAVCRAPSTPAEQLLHLTAIGKPVFQVPDRTALALLKTDMARDTRTHRDLLLSIFRIDDDISAPEPRAVKVLTRFHHRCRSWWRPAARRDRVAKS
jgi:hypothetical protein